MVGPIRVEKNAFSKISGLQVDGALNRFFFVVKSVWNTKRGIDTLYQSMTQFNKVLVVVL